VLAGKRRPVAGDRRAPRWLQKIVDRALEVVPARRYPSMQTLLDDLERGLLRRRRLSLVAGALALSVGAGLLGSRAGAPSLCARGPEVLAQTWNDSSREAARAAFLAADRPFAAHAWAQTEAALDTYAGEWVAMYGEACEATRVRGDQSEAALDLRMRCLDRRQGELAALLAVFAEADVKTVTHALEASDALKPVASCGDLDGLASAHMIPEDPRIRGTVALLRDQIARARALRHAGHYDQALPLARDADARARALDYPPLQAEALLQLGSLAALRGAPSDAATTLDRAFLAALACDHPEVAAWAAIESTHTIGFLLHRPAEGRRWGELAEPLLARIGHDPVAAAALQANLGNIEVATGALDQARARFTAALAIAETEIGGDHIVVANTAANLAAVFRRTGDHAAALAHYARARDIFYKRLGPTHPALVSLTNNTGVLRQVSGDLEGAERNYREVLGFAGPTLPANTPTFGHAHNNLAEVLLLRGEPAEALRHAEAAVAVFSAAHGEQHPLVGEALVGLGRIHIELAEADPALAVLQRALEIQRAAKVSAGTTAATQFELARALVLAAPADPTEAIASARAAAAALASGPEHDKIVAWLADLTAPRG
jgi:tetratricopeptide (TPR) repeat protein